MLRIKFKYRDQYSNGKWCIQECQVDSIKECIQIYGLDECEYQILSADPI